jgi:hypothetical protein
MNRPRVQIRVLTLLALSALFHTAPAPAVLPPPNAQWADWPTAWAPDAPGDLSAADLLPKPAGAAGPLAVRDGHFYCGNQRIRFWGVNFAFAACFPTHEQADAVAQRLSRFGINAVRLHHMDNQPFPNGIWADRSGEKLSPEALDRLDYLMAALKKQGIYSDLNLHVSRDWSKAHHWENADKLPESYDKVLDVFHPDLVAANKQYAREILSHVNAYTKNRYADEPAIGVVEINNEDTLFIWGGEAAIAKFPEPYAGLLKQLWNQWLVRKYGAREKLKAAWSGGEAPLGPNLLKGDLAKGWNVEQHDSAKMTVAPSADAATITVTHVDGTDWHLQFNQAGLKLAAGKYYTVSFNARSDKPTQIAVAVSQAHDSYGNLGLSASPKLDSTDKPFSFGFTATADDDNGRLAFSLGRDVNTITLSKIELHEGGRLGLHAGEDPAKTTVASHAPGDPETKPRSADWFDFLQQTDEHYWVDMLQFLKKDLGVKCPITGTIGLGPLGTLSQSKMDFVDAHSYWDHPHFPHRPWDMNDWLIKNQPMVDHPDGATLWGLASTRVKGKPFTVTEYNHAAPNEWQAECLPMIAAYAATQDWDGVFLFAYSHSLPYDKQKISSFFDVEGNPLMMPLMPLASRIFLGEGIKPSEGDWTILADRNEMLRTASQFYYQTWPWARSQNLKWDSALRRKVSIDFNFNRHATPSTFAVDDPRLQWSATGPGTGAFRLVDARAAVFAGFAPAEPVDLGAVRLDKLDSAFASLIVTPADPTATIESADRVLIAAVARAQNREMRWDESHHTVSTQWGQPPPQVEVVRGSLSLRASGKRTVYCLTPDGKRGPVVAAEESDGRLTIPLGTVATVWYEVVKE